MHDTITGPVFQEMLIFGATSIAKEKQSINDLNVFPVPDGDTGTNMSLTMHAAAQELQKRREQRGDIGQRRGAEHLPCTGHLLVLQDMLTLQRFKRTVGGVELHRQRDELEEGDHAEEDNADFPAATQPLPAALPTA